MEKLTTTLSAHDRVILFCVATATDYAAVGITVPPSLLAQANEVIE